MRCCPSGCQDHKRARQEQELDVVAIETYPTGTIDFSAVLKKVQEAAPDLLS
jgi:hypothetical protein